MNELIRRLGGKSFIPGIPLWLVPLGLISVLFLLLQSIKHRRENFSVFLFDYEHGFIRRGLLGSIVELLPSALERHDVFIAIYTGIAVLSYFLVLALFRKSLNWNSENDVVAKLLMCAFILLSPIFLKNSYWDFGRVDQLGFFCLLAFALASPRAQSVLVILLPPFLILCHEGQIILSVAPMIAIFLVGILREGSLLQPGRLVPLLASILVSLALTIYFLLHGVPGVEPEVLSQYFESKSQHNTKERSWLLYDSVATNMEIGMGRGREGVQLAASPVYLLAFILHLPVILILYRAFKDSSEPRLRLASSLIAFTVVAQCVIFFLSIDYTRHVANLFFSFVVMLFFLIQRFNLDDLVAAHCQRFRSIFIALLFISLPLRKFGIVTP